MRGYKVLTRKRRSCIVGHGQGGLVYPIGEPVIPINGYGPLCVFKDKKNAKNFVVWCMALEFTSLLVMCEYEPSRRRNVWQPHHRYQLRDLPQGTALATTVTCLE